MERIIRSNAVETSSQSGVCGIFISRCVGALPKKYQRTEIGAGTNRKSIIRNIGNYRSTSLQIVLDPYFERWRLICEHKDVGTEEINKNKIPAIPSESSQTSFFRLLVTKTLIQIGVAKLKSLFWCVLINKIESLLYASVPDGLVQLEQGISKTTTQYTANFNFVSNRNTAPVLSPTFPLPRGGFGRGVLHLLPKCCMLDALVANISQQKNGFLQKKIALKTKFDYPCPDYNIITTKVISIYLDIKSNEHSNQHFQVETDLDSTNLTNVRNKNPTIKLKLHNTFTARIVM
jgi:hypothetical protein